uniref:Uncharacterized protein n=1 Tax=Anser brachyrhynchus TaxID=132585 RepID=A0A8B9CED6_9AVES
MGFFPVFAKFCLPESTPSLSARSMHGFPLLCSLLLCNGLMVAAQEKVQKPPKEEEESPAQIRIPQTLSRALRKAFASSPEIQQMAQEDFIMLNLVHSSSDDNMAPDGHYVPRILFVDPSMTVRADLTGKYGNRMYAYEPEDISTLIENMRQAKLLLHTEL